MIPARICSFEPYHSRTSNLVVTVLLPLKSVAKLELSFNILLDCIFVACTFLEMGRDSG